MKTAIVEIRESHEECIYTQLRFLKDAGHEVTLILHPILADQISDYANLADSIQYIDFNSAGFFKKLHLQVHLFRLLKDFELIILNTAHSYKILRNLIIMLRVSRTTCVGVLHDTKKLEDSFTQRIISKKVKKYFVLNDALLPSEEYKGSSKVQSFYPIFFPSYPPVPVYKQQHIWIGIPGRIDYSRRDYDFLVNSLSLLTRLIRVKFLILGKVDREGTAGKRLYDSIANSKQLERFKLFHSFIPNHEYHTYLAACDYIMPLLTLSDDYLESKISGTFNLAFAHRKTLLCSSFFASLPDLAENGIFYDEDSLTRLITDIDEGREQYKSTYTHPKWDYKFQQRRYISFIND